MRCGVARSKTPCVESKRPRVCRHHAHMLKHMFVWCGYTQGRFGRIHGDVLNLQTEAFLNVHTVLPKDTQTHTHTHQTQHQSNITRRQTERERRQRKREKTKEERGNKTKEEREKRRREEGEEERRRRKQKQRSHVHQRWHVHVGITLFAHFLLRKRSLEHLLSMMSAFRSL